MTMELRHLRYFVAVAEALSFSRAAEKLHLTQPALSRQMRDLEHELGCRLLTRGANVRTELTSMGRRFLVGAKRVLQAADALVEETRAQKEVLRFGHYGAIWLDHFAPALRHFAKRHPRVTVQPVELTPKELAQALRSGEIDVGLVGLVDERMRRDFHARRVASYPTELILAVTHPLAKRRRLRLQDLRDVAWATWDASEFPGRKQLLVEACRRVGFRPRIAFETDSLASMLMQVATTELVGHVAPYSRRLPHQGVVFTQLHQPDDFMSEVQAAWRRGDPRIRLITELVDDLVADGPKR